MNIEAPIFPAVRQQHNYDLQCPKPLFVLVDPVLQIDIMQYKTGSWIATL